MAVFPILRSDVHARHGAAISGSDHERQALSIQVGVHLPVLAPVAPHGLPPSSGAFDLHCLDGATAADVGDEHQVEELVSVDGEVHAARPLARNSAHHGFIDGSEWLQLLLYVVGACHIELWSD